MGQYFKNRNASITFLSAIIILSMAIPASSSACQHWNGMFGGASGDIAYPVQQTSDRGYIQNRGVI